MPPDDIRIWADRLGRFHAEARQHLAVFESSSARTITLDQSYERLNGLTLKQDDLFRQALRCIEVEVFRAAHVMCWSATIDYLYSVIWTDGAAALISARSGWTITSASELRESHSDFAVIEAMKAAGYLTKGEEKAFKGLLSRRNECAHPSDFLPGLNETLGYLSESFKRVESLQKRFCIT